MTEIVEEPAREEVLDLIDQGLAHLREREIISASEVADLLLDLRLLLATADETVGAGDVS